MADILKFPTSKGSARKAVLSTQDEIAIAAHDLRNPLSCILLNLELVEAKFHLGKTENIEALIGRGIRAAERMEDMIKKLLVDAKQNNEFRGGLTEAEQALSVSKSYCSLKLALQTSIEHNQPRADQKSISLKFASEKDIVVETDEGLLVEAIDNLINNAIKYSEPYTEIICSIGQDLQSAFICITDQGPGLTNQDIGCIGQPYQTLSAKPTAGEQSTGLGLWSTKRIAQALSGTLTAENGGENTGATFALNLPLATPSSQIASYLDC